MTRIIREERRLPVDGDREQERRLGTREVFTRAPQEEEVKVERLSVAQRPFLNVPDSALPRLLAEQNRLPQTAPSPARTPAERQQDARATIDTAIRLRQFNQYIASRSAAPEILSAIAASSTNIYDRLILAKNPATPPEVLEVLIKDTRELAIANAVLSNPNYSRDKVDIAASDLPRFLQGMVRDADFFEPFLTSYPEMIANNPNAPALTLDKLVSPQASRQTLLAVASNPNASPSALQRLYAMDASVFTLALAANPNTPADVQLEIDRASFRQADEALAKNPNVLPEIAQRLAASASPRLYNAIAANPSIARDAALIARLPPRAILGLAANPQLSGTALVELARRAVSEPGPLSGISEVNDVFDALYKNPAPTLAELDIIRQLDNRTSEFVRLDVALAISNRAHELSPKEPFHVRETSARARLKQGHVGAAFQTLMADPETSQRARRVLASGEARRAVDGLSANEVRNIGRPGWLAAMADPSTRDFMIESVNREARAMSDQLKREKRIYSPTLVIGTGPQAATYVNELKRRAPHRQVLMAEASDRLGGGNFAASGKMFRLNSREGQDTGARPLPGSDETLNKLVGPITPSDLVGGRWNEADSVAQAAAVNAYASGAQFLLDERLLTIRDGNLGNVGKTLKWPGRYEVTYESGRVSFHDRIVVASGVGSERMPGDEASQRIISEEQSKIDLHYPERVPQALSVSQALRLAQGSASPREAYRGKDNVTVVVGGGDSAKTFVELLQGLGPDAAYTGSGKDDVAQNGPVGQMYWLSGKSGFGSCDEYLAASRPRYAALAVALKAPSEERLPRVQAERAEFVGVSRDNGRLRVAFDLYDKDRMKVGTTSVLADHVVFGVGYRDQLGDAMSGLTGTVDYKRELDIVTARPQGFSEEVAVASTLRGHDVRFVGPAAGTLTSDSELRGINENKAGLFVLSPRTQAAARSDAESQAADAGLATRPEPLARVPVALEVATHTAVVEAQGPPLASATIAADRSGLFAQAQLAQLLARFQFSGGECVDLSFQRREGRLTVTSHSVPAAALDAINAALQSDVALLDRLRTLTDFGARPRVAFSFPLQAGQVSAATAHFVRERKLP